MNSENIKRVTSQAIEQLVEALNAGHSEALTRYLGAMAKFRAYSLLNVLLILKQRPNAGRIAGYKTWQSLGQVKKGERHHDPPRCSANLRTTKMNPINRLMPIVSRDFVPSPSGTNSKLPAMNCRRSEA